MSNIEELHREMDELSQRFAQVENNPRAWTTWITYLLAQLETQAMDVNPQHQEIYEDMLAALKDAIQNRLDTGGWRA